jgi:hypothetical protein
MCSSLRSLEFDEAIVVTGVNAAQVVGPYRPNPSVSVCLDAPPPGATIERRHNLALEAIELGRPPKRVQLDPGANPQLQPPVKLTQQQP